MMRSRMVGLLGTDLASDTRAYGPLENAGQGVGPRSLHRGTVCQGNAPCDPANLPNNAKTINKLLGQQLQRLPTGGSSRREPRALRGSSTSTTMETRSLQPHRWGSILRASE